MLRKLYLLTYLGLTIASLSILLDGNWQETPFSLNLLESISNIDEKYFQSTIKYMANSIEDDEEEIDDEEFSDLSLFNYVSGKLPSSSSAFLNFSLTYKQFAPRIQSHYDYYNSVVEPIYLERVLRQCQTDSFGNQILTESSPYPQAWLLYNDKIYCSPDEIFALQTDKVSEHEEDILLPFDRIIGGNKKAPLLVLYGDVRTGFFKRMLQNLYISASSGKVRFVWRYITLQYLQTLPMEKLVGYGVDLTFKRTDYITIDDRDSLSTSYLSEGIHLTNEESSQLGLKLTSKILQSQSFEELLELLEDFPNKISAISNFTVDTDSIRENMLANEMIGLSKDSIGLYVNGAPIDKLELDVFKLAHKVSAEYDLISKLESFGFNVEQSKILVSKFALLSAVKQAQFYQGNTMMGKNENRFKLYQHEYIPDVTGDGSTSGGGGVIYFNNLETDDNYQQFPTDRMEAYAGKSLQRLKQGQIPILRENVHELIFAIDITDKDQLRLFFQFSKLILDRSLPQQLGLIPFSSESKFSKSLIERFYFVSRSSSTESLALLYKYLETKTDEEIEELINDLVLPDDFDFYPVHSTTLDVFSIAKPSVILNGVINELESPNWQTAFGKQIIQDVKLIQQRLSNSYFSEKTPLRSILYENARTKRNLKIVPTDLSTLSYKLVSEELIDNSILVSKKSGMGHFPRNFWLIGDLNKERLRNQFIEILKLMNKSSDIQLRIVSTSKTSPLFLNKILNSLSTYDIMQLIKEIEAYYESTSGLNDEVLSMLSRNRCPLSHSYILLNSRYIRLDDVLSTEELSQLVEFESNQRLGVVEELFSSYTKKFDGMSLLHFNSGEYSHSDWYDLVTSTVTKSFYVDEKLYLSDVSRYDFNMLNDGNSLQVVSSSKDDKKVDILLIIDPIDEFSQKAVSILQSVIDFPFVNIKIILQPHLLTKDNEDMAININRLYRGIFPRSIISFDSFGAIKKDINYSISTPNNVLLTTDLDLPTNWIATLKSVPYGIDMDNFLSEGDDEINISYELKLLLVEGFARDTRTGKPPSGLALEIESTDPSIKKDSTVMASLGYFQLQGKPGLWKLKIQPDSPSEKYFSLLSGNENQYESNTDALAFTYVPVFDLAAHNLKLRVKKNSGYEGMSLLESEEDNKNKGLFSTSSARSSSADINIFTIVSGNLYERFLSIMTASVREHTNHTVKFWIIENYISPSFKKLIPYLAVKYDFEYEFVTYRWPQWLRQQREKQRTIWGYKILFLDVLFPQDLDKVIFVDADQVVRTDMKQLVDEDLEGRVYGFTPMCDSREEMEGFRFWKQGYWSKLLGDTLKYHISALYVVDLKEFRRQGAGNILRSNYQKLSSDPGSLSNLDQDLPNNIQKQLPIHSLDQDWLWCETWCSDQSLKSARTIDLCNNPLTKEPKLERAKRQIPEWVEYDDEVSQLIEKLRQDEAKEQELEASMGKEEENVILAEQDEYEGDGDQEDDYDIYDEL